MIEKLPYEEIINKYRSASELNKKYVKEIDRLNSIINELEKDLNEAYISFQTIMYVIERFRDK